MDISRHKEATYEAEQIFFYQLSYDR